LACFAFYILLWLPTLAYLPMLLNLDKPEFQWVVTPLSITILAGLGAMLLGLLLLLPRLGGAMRLVSLILLLGGAVAFGIGTWGHYRGLYVDKLGIAVSPDSEHLVTMAARIDPMPVLSSYLGLALAGAMFLALGLLVSSLVRSQMVAALISLVLCLLFLAGGFWRPDLDTGSMVARVLNFFSVPRHFNRDFARGVVDTRHLILYVSVAVFSLFLTVRSLESRRWR
jgi:hypothetical protein